MAIHKGRCQHCGSEFESRKNTKFCTQKCYFASRDKKVNLECVWCKKKFILPFARRVQQFCSIGCFNSATKRNRENNICQQCGEEFEVTPTTKISKFCSLDCKHTSMRNGNPEIIDLTCEGCGTVFKKKYTKRSTRFCSKSCATSGERNAMYGMTGLKSSWYGKPAWNHGLTAETDIRVKNLGKKISKITKKQFEDGTRSNSGENNPNYGRTVDTRTPEQLDNYSKAALKRVKDGVSCNHQYANYKRGKYVSEKTGSKMTYRSSWEQRVMICLDKDPEILTYSYESVSVRYGENYEKRYLIDFDITLKSGKRTLLEVKPTELIHKKTVQLKAAAAQAYAQNAGAEFRFCTNVDIKEWEKRLEL